MKIGRSFIGPNQKLAFGKSYFIIIVFLLTFLPGFNSFAQDYPEYEEIALFLDVPNLGGAEIDVLIKGNDIYLPITDFFDFLKIRNVPSAGLDTISGFFINQEATYSIIRENNEIQYGKELYKLQPGDLIRTETNLFLNGKYYGQIFGLDCEFSFRNMSVRVNTRLELPAIREMRQEAMRKNMNRLVGEVEADTNIGRKYPFFHFGMADWSVNLTERINGPSDARLNLALGAILAGGEATVSLNYNSHTEFTEKQQYYLWRYVNNDNRALRQIMAGKIATGATSSIYDPVVGVQLTNASTKFKRSFGSYTLSDRTEPNWIVELYVNNELVDYTTADPSGFFTFEVPMVYGNTNVRLKFYGPWGEERVREQNITVPFNFVPKKTLEYKVSAGMIQDYFNSTFARAQANYGLFSSVTVGTGVEYLSSLTTGELMPFVNGSFRLAPNLMLSGEYSPEVRSKGTLTYRLPSSLQFDVNYIYYKKGQQAINNNFREERKVSMSMPIRFSNVSVYNRLTVNQLVLPTSNYTTGEWLISGALFGVSTNITSYAIFIGNTKPYYYSDFSVSFRLPLDISVQPRVQYSYTNKKLLSAKDLVEKRVLKKAYLTASYEQNFQSHMHLVEVGFRYDFNFAQTSFLTRQTNNSTTFVQFARGSIINDSQTNYVKSDNRSNVGKGGISILAFLDKNGNGTQDEGEPKAYGLNIRANSGRIEKREQDTTIRIFGLEPYTDCYIEFDQNSFDNIAWRLKHLSMSIAVDPNMIKLVEIPINIVGEAAGMVRMDKAGAIRGIGRVIVNIYDKNQKRVGRTLSEDDGYFSYFGLIPGNYDVRIDTNQLQKLGMNSTPKSIDFNIAAILDGDYVDGLDFVLKMDTALETKEPEEDIKLEPIDMMVYIQSELVVDTTQGHFAIELGAFKKQVDADTLREQLSTLTGKEANLVFEDDQYKVRISGFTSKNEIEDYFPALQSKGINKISMISLMPVAEPRMVASIPDTPIDTVIMYSENDTTVLALNEVIKDDTSSSTDSYEIKVGAFVYEAEADSLREQLSTLSSKEAQLIYEDGRYRVLITGFATKEKTEDYFPALKGKGIGAIAIVSVKGVAEQRHDMDIFIVHDVVKEDTTTTDDSYVIELATFDNEIEANSFLTELATLKGKEPKLVFEDDQYKVQIDELSSKSEIQDYFPIIKSKGIDEISVIGLKGMAEPRRETEIVGLDSNLAEKDSTVFIVHEVIKEDTTTLDDSFVIELAAFDNEPEANTLRDQISTLQGKEANIVFEDNQYKVQITGITTKEETKDYFPVIKSKGISEVSIISLKGKAEPRLVAEILVAEKDTTILIVHEIIEEDLTSSTDSYVIQVGAFKRKSYAKRLKNKLSGILDKEVIITEENGFYKVRITGFSSIYDLEKFIPVLVKKGYTEIWVVTLKGMLKPGSDRDIVQSETELINTYTKDGTTYFIIYESIEEDRTTTDDSYAIQLGAFRNKINAEVLKIRMNTYLDREVEIYLENGLYNVRIPEFKSRKEVDDYVPKLIELGVKEIRVLNIKGIQEHQISTNRIDTIQASDFDSTTTIIDTKRKKKITIKPVKKVVVREDEAKKKTTVEYRKETVKPPPVTVRSTLEDRMLEAEYKTGLYEARWPGVEFVIQIAASKSISDPEVIKQKFGLSGEVNVTRADEWYRFSVGSYIKYWQAREYRNILRTRNGMEDAIIVAYKDGKKIMFRDLLAIAENTPLTGLTVRPVLSKAFSVQVLATKDENVTVASIRELYGIDEEIFKEYDESDGLYRYSIGNFTLYTDAAKVRNKIKVLGFKEVFVIGYKDGKRVADLKSLLDQ